MIPSRTVWMSTVNGYLPLRVPRSVCRSLWWMTPTPTHRTCYITYSTCLYQGQDQVRTEKSPPKNHKHWNTWKYCYNYPKIWTRWLYHGVICENKAGGMANSVDLRSRLIWVYTVCINLSVWRLNIIMHLSMFSPRDGVAGIPWGLHSQNSHYTQEFDRQLWHRGGNFDVPGRKSRRNDVYIWRHVQGILDPNLCHMGRDIKLINFLG